MPVSFMIRHFSSGKSTDEIWKGTLTDAQDAFCQKVRDGALDRVEIRPVGDKLIFQYPIEPRVSDTTLRPSRRSET